MSMRAWGREVWFTEPPPPTNRETEGGEQQAQCEGFAGETTPTGGDPCHERDVVNYNWRHITSVMQLHAARQSWTKRERERERDSCDGVG